MIIKLSFLTRSRAICSSIIRLSLMILSISFLKAASSAVAVDYAPPQIIAALPSLLPLLAVVCCKGVSPYVILGRFVSWIEALFISEYMLICGWFSIFVICWLALVPQKVSLAGCSGISFASRRMQPPGNKEIEAAIFESLAYEVDLNEGR